MAKRKAEPEAPPDPVEHYRPKPREFRILHAVLWDGTTKQAQVIIAFCRDTNGLRRIVVFRPVNTGGDVALHVWVDGDNLYKPVPLGYYVCRFEDSGGYFVRSQAQLDRDYELLA